MTRIAKSLPRKVTRPQKPVEDSQEIVLLKGINEKLASLPKPKEPKDVQFPNVQKVQVLNNPVQKDCIHEVNEVYFPELPEYPTEIKVSNLKEVQVIAAADLPLPSGAATAAEQAITIDKLEQLHELLNQFKFKNDGTLKTSGSEQFKGGGGGGGNFLQGILDALEATLTVTSAAPTGLLGGQSTISAPGTAQALGASTTIVSITIKAKRTNTGNIYVGDATCSSTTGLILERGATADLNIADLASIYIDGDGNTDGVSFLYLTA
jgi:hypothetical protein